MSSIWDVIWTFFWIFAFVAYLMILFTVITDLFRDHKLNGWWKALWVILLVWVPFITAFVYLIVRGRSMAARATEAQQRAQQAAESYIKEVAGTSAADEIAKAKTLLDSGAITADEFATLKAKALA